MPDFPASREAALNRLRAFSPKAGRAYAAGRNTDFSEPDQQAVSMLSPYLRRRMITEREVVAEVLKLHSADAAEKFIQEVFWRTYWKGWLEMRPAVWDRYLSECEAALADPPNGYQSAIEGRTGIEGFDDWAQELVQTGWLHNHARMWFASIWIFTLRLPWALGADFFYRHLLDADPASNTLSWRWVAGLHTKGKTYLARTDNIEKYTNGRFRPSGLAPFAEPLVEPFDIPAPLPPRQSQTRVPNGPYALLLTDDDLHPESWPGFETNPPQEVIVLNPLPQKSNLNSGEIARQFSKDALHDALVRIDRPTMFCDAHAGGLERTASGLTADGLLVPYQLCGPSASILNQSLVKIEEQGVTVHELKRSWDDHAWPYATAGFFKLKKKIPSLLSKAGLTG
ncbi:MAG: FAD-binding domain-containing protein [Hyphomicrobiales bacterium]|jgi:deoxyribodipyrimidine photo-lyase